MPLEKLIQVKISGQLYDELVREAITTGLTIAQVCRLRLAGKKIADRESGQGNKKFRPVGVQPRREPEQNLS